VLKEIALALTGIDYKEQQKKNPISYRNTHHPFNNDVNEFFEDNDPRDRATYDAMPNVLRAKLEEMKIFDVTSPLWSTTYIIAGRLS
jgi:hypothetical protein